MQMKEIVKLIKSLHYNHHLRRSSIYNTCLDTLGAEDVNKETLAEFKAFIDAAFTACPKELQVLFKEQEKQDNMLVAAKSRRILSSDNVITGYFK